MPDAFLRRVIKRREYEQAAARRAQLARERWDSPENVAERKEEAAKKLRRRGYAWVLGVEK